MLTNLTGCTNSTSKTSEIRGGQFGRQGHLHKLGRGLHVDAKT